MRIEKFEDLIAWQKARQLTKRIYLETRTSMFRRDVALRNQMRRAVVSVVSNIAEGFERGGAQFRHFLAIAKASCAEVKTQIYVAFDIGYIPEHLVTELLRDTEEVARVIGGLRKSIPSTRISRTRHSSLATRH